ncbi:MAG: 5-formyltetrahydrofolate cyclo-ligase [Planctomycetia bacterium]|nr:5-formyltetrahydrofolate cyclo-ligase [Planctomycetia bacterium]
MTTDQLASNTSNPSAQASADEMHARKKVIREQAHAARGALENKDELSRGICEKFVALPEYAAAKTVMYYVDVRSEVRTRHYLATALTHGKRIVVPWCREDGMLDLFLLEDMNELAIGMYKILEPRADLRDLPAKKIRPEELDLIMVPGVAFDARGARTGHGFGYYDKLLEHSRMDCPLVALAFECQMFPEIPTAAHDIYMDKIITEATIYNRQMPTRNG